MTLLTATECAALERLAQVSRGRGGFGGAIAAGAGRGFEQAGHDPWRAGEDPRHLDWQARLRTGSWWVRRFHAEGDVPLRIIVDVTASMTDAKRGAARRIAAAWAFLCADAGVPYSVETLDNLDPEGSTRPRIHRRWRQRVRAALGKRASVQAGLIEALAHLSGSPMRCRAVVVSDFADSAGPDAVMSAVSRIGQVVACAMLVEHADAELPAEVRIGSPESRGAAGMRMARDVDAAGRAGFARRVQEWRAQCVTAARQRGMAMHVVNVDDAIELVAVMSRLVMAWS